MKEVILESTGKKLTQFIVIPFAIIDEVESLIIAYCTEIEGQSEARAEFMMKCVDVLKQRIVKIRSAASMNKLNTELKTSNHQLQQYSYIVSHNLRAPISNLHGILNLLTPESVVNERDKILFVKLNETVRSIDRILIELNELLMVKDALNVTLESIHLRELVDSVVKTLEADFQTVHADIEIDFSNKEDITAYKPYLISIFQNLLSNAYKFRSVDRRLKVKIESAVDSNGETIITFSDNGIGIDMERNRERVFRLYSRFHRHVQGTGMGLYLIKEQLKAMGGEIEIESAVDVGTKFIMHFKK
jgi:signal transduction histidine kinase